MVITMFILLTVTVSASFPEPKSYSSRNEFHYSVIEARQNSEKTSETNKVNKGTEEDEAYFEIEKIENYIDFKNVVKDVKLYEIRVLQSFTVLFYHDITGERGGNALRISWTDGARYGENYDYLADMIRMIGSNHIKINHNGNAMIKAEVYRDELHVASSYYWVYEGRDVSMTVPTWLLELYPEETFFDVKVVNVSLSELPPFVKLDGKILDFDTPPMIEEGRTLVPMRAIFEAFGAEVGWDGESQTVTATAGDKTISMQIGNAQIQVNGETVTLDVPPQVVNDRTVVERHKRYILVATLCAHPSLYQHFATVSGRNKYILNLMPFAMFHKI